MTVNELLKVLPPFKAERDVIVQDDQTTRQIMKEVLEAHQVFADHYDYLVGKFNKDNLLRQLFNFCMKYLPYDAETVEVQTTRSPAAILSLRNIWGSDCKHYAGWIGGIIDAYNRAGLTDFDWCYRFVSYRLLAPWAKEHVFVAVSDGENEIWLDPAPIIDDDGTRVTRYYNDRLSVPFYETNKIPEMSIERISGIPGQAMGYIVESDVAYDDYGYGGGGGTYYSVNYVTDKLIDYPAAVVDTPYFEGLPVSESDSTVVTDQARIIEMVPEENVYTMAETTETNNSPVPTNAGTLSVNFGVWDFVKNNPIEVLLVGGVLATGLYFIFKKPKKKKRA